MFKPENVVVRVGNELDGVPGEVKATLDGIAALSGGLIAIGHRSLITHGLDTKSFDSLIGQINTSFGDRDTVDRFNQRHGDTLDHQFEAAKKGLAGEAFKRYVWELGALDTQYRLAQLDEDKDILTLTVIGSD
jgi:hypothetical protein